MANNTPKKINQTTISQSQTLNNSQTKKESSYTYWVKERQDLGIEYKPTKIEDVQMLQKMQTQSLNNSYTSAWNTAGTWEDKTLKRDQLEKILNSFMLVEEEGSSIKITGIKVLQGEGQVIMVRGKRKIGYEMNIEVAIEIKEVGKGIITMRDLCDDEDECSEYKVQSDQGSNAKLLQICKDESAKVILRMKSTIEKYRNSL